MWSIVAAVATLFVLLALVMAFVGLIWLNLSNLR